MSGKTTFIRIIGINVLLAQTLHTAFARTFALSAPIKIYSALMLADDLSEGKSFYMKEVDTIKEMISRSQEGTANLFLFDEIFKGTNTTERIAVAKAVLSYLNTTDNIIVATTHDAELATLLDTEYDLYHFSEVIQDETFSFDYKLKSGPLYQRNAIRLLEINGFPPTVIRDAYRTIEKISYPPTSTQFVLTANPLYEVIIPVLSFTIIVTLNVTFAVIVNPLTVSLYSPTFHLSFATDALGCSISSTGKFR